MHQENKNIPNWEHERACQLLERLPKAINTYAIDHPAFPTAKTDTDTVVLGAVAGDIIGSTYEGWDYRDAVVPDFMPLITESGYFTDDTVLTAAVLAAARKSAELGYDDCEAYLCYRSSLKSFAKAYPDAGYGGKFYAWGVRDEEDPAYQSHANGAAMRVACLGALFERQEDVIRHSFLSALPTHSHEDGIKGAVTAAMCVWIANHGGTMGELVAYVEKHWPNGFRHMEERMLGKRYLDVNLSVDQLAALQAYAADMHAGVAVPESVIVLRESSDYDTCIRNIYRFWADCDTVGTIAGAMAAAYYGKVDLAEEDVCAVMEKLGKLRDMLFLEGCEI